MLLHEMFDFHGRVRGEHEFARFAGASITYERARERSLGIAAGLRDFGLKPGDRVAVLAQNSTDLLLVFLAASRMGVVVVPLNYRLVTDELRDLILDAECAAIVSDSAFCDGLDACEGLGRLHRVSIGGPVQGWVGIDDWAASVASYSEAPVVTPQDIIFHMYTSGTTGRPKGALISHRNISTNIAQSTFAMPWKLNPGERTLVVLPLFHIAAISTVMCAIACGATLVIHSQVDPNAIVECLEKEDIVTLSLVPAVIQYLLAVPEIEQRSFSKLQSIGYGASPIAEPVLRRALQVFKCAFVQGYGMTELSGSCCLLSEADHRRALRDRPDLLLSAGRALPGCEVKIVDPDGRTMSTGEIGEIVVRGDLVMTGYWKMPDATLEAIRGGWLHTGDAGSMDAEGYLTIRDRLKDMIVSGAENIYPAEIEAVLFSHAGIADVSVIGVPDERWGETVMAIVVARPSASLTEEDLDEFCRARLGGFKVPRRYKFVSVLPRNASGKVLKRDLRAQFWQGHSRQVS